MGEPIQVGKLDRLTLKKIILTTVWRRLVIHDWNRTAAAKSLGVCVRTMRKWIHVLRASGIRVEENPHYTVPWRKKEPDNVVDMT